MNKVVFIIPYFGKLPNTFSLWLTTAKNNPGIDFLFFTDSSEIKEEKNIKVVRSTLGNIKELFETKLQCNISLETPYKLCDYKAMYGYLFQDYIKEYDFWGYCDIDLLFGNISHYITETILENYDKIYELGHFTIYRNNTNNNAVFMFDGDYPEFNYREVISSPESFYFDEHFGMRIKNRRIGTKTYYSDGDYFDVSVNEFKFHDAIMPDRDVDYFKYDDGVLYAIDKNGNEEEILYVHLQKRRMDVLTEKDSKQFIIVPNKIIPYSDKVKFNMPSHKEQKEYKCQLKFQHVKDFVRRYNQARSNYKSIFHYYKSRQLFKKRRIDAKNTIAMMK